MAVNRAKPWTVDASGTIFVHVHVQPRARKAGIAGVHEMPSGPVFKVALKSPPLEGRANDELTELFAGLLGLKQSAVSVESGHKSRDKRLRLTGGSAILLERLAGG